ncbi:MAG: hypothetical protein LAT67_02520 [Balneolales bacterium]|nr:hypothetical protein [Balneolales bacterium]
MKKSLLIITVLTIASAIVLQSCDKDANIQQRDSSINQSVDTNTNQLQNEITAFKLEAENDIRENNRHISEVKLEIENRDSDARVAHTERIKEIERKNIALKRQIDTYNYSTQSHWDTFKTDFNNSMEEIERSLDGFFVATSPTTTTTKRN